MTTNRSSRFVGRAGEKLDFALHAFDVDVTDAVAADLGCHVGGFTDCLLQRGARRVYAVDTGYGQLDWGLRNDERVVVMERQNALHVELPEPVDVVTVDVGWTRQHLIVPRALALTKAGGAVVSLLKPQYEAERKERRRGVVRPEALDGVVERVVGQLRQAGFHVAGCVRSPLVGGGGNVEFLLLLSVG